MKKLIFALAIAAASLATPVFAANVSINVGEPGFFGRIDIGGLPAPRLLAPRAVIIESAPVGVVREPYYLSVPPEHQRNWRHYCARYNACGHPVYFVDHRWYNDVYVPHYREHHMHEQHMREERHEEHRAEVRHEEVRHEEHRREERREEHHDARHDEHHDDGHDHDHDNDHDHH